MKSRLVLFLIMALTAILALSGCGWFHECEITCAECGKCLDAECAEGVCANKCVGHHKCEHVCKECNGCLDAECREEACAEKCSCHIKETLCPECGGCVYTGCKEAICMQKCSCPKYVNVDEGIVAALSNHLDDIRTDHDLISWTLSRQIKEVKNGAQPLLVTFDSVETYYVGVYFIGEHYIPDYPLEIADYCCHEEYVWVRFDSTEDITKTYNNRYLLAAFTIWNIHSVMDIRSENANAPSFVLFDTFSFSGNPGDEITPPKLPIEVFIFINTNIGADTVYHGLRSYKNHFYFVDCAILSDEYYLIYPMHTIINEFEEYYDELIAITNTEGHWITNRYGGQEYCAIIKVNDFSKFLKEE